MDSSRTPTILDDGMRLGIEHLLADESLACMNVTAELAVETAALLHADRHHQPLAGQVADMLEGSVMGGLCLLNVAKCTAASFLLEEIAETALPDAVRAADLAGTFRAYYLAET
jgi:hypothetical protein